MTRQTVQTGTNANDGTGDTLRQAGRKINENFEELYNFLGTGDVLSQNVTLSDLGVEFGTTNPTTLVAIPATSPISVNLPGIATTLVGTNTTDTLSNKTLLSPTINNAVLDILKIDDAGANNTITFVAPDVAADTNINLPLLTDSDTFVFTNNAADLKNKRLVNPYIKGSIFDSADNEFLEFQKVNSAATHLKVHNSTAAANLPKITGAGLTNTNIGIEPTGTGAVRLGKVAFSSRLIETISPQQPSTAEDTIIYVDLGAANETINLDDGTVDGEWKIVHNKTTGTSIITIASNTSQGITLPGQAAGDYTVTLGKNDVAQFTWDGVDETWRFIGGADSASSLLI